MSQEDKTQAVGAALTVAVGAAALYSSNACGCKDAIPSDAPASDQAGEPGAAAAGSSSAAAGAAEAAQPARFRLYQFPGRPGLAAYHPACLKARGYMRACIVRAAAAGGGSGSGGGGGGGGNLNFGTDERGSVHVTEAATLPVLHDVQEDEWVAGASEIVQHLAKAGEGGAWDLDAGLSKQQKAEAAAFTALVETKLYLAMLQHWWVDDEGYDVVSRPVYATALPCPLSLYLPWILRRRQVQRATHSGVGTAAAAKAAAAECLGALDARLGSQNFFFGDAPTSLDATVYGYLECIEKFPQRPHGNWLHELLQAHPRLKAFTSRFYAAFVENDPTKDHRQTATVGRPAKHAKTARVAAAAKAARAKAEHAAANGEPEEKLSEAEQQLRWENRVWAGVVATSVLSYVAFMPHWFGT
eukprot:SAG22_NODE_313_length_12610_cov_5.778275_3_plen_414_part_00